MICKTWAEQHNNFSNTLEEDDHSSNYDSDDECSCGDEIDELTNNRLIRTATDHQYQFDSSVYDFLQRIIVLKVFSHQMNPDFTIRKIGEKPGPNTFVVSANQIADNAATQAQKFYEDFGNIEIIQCYYPPFSPRWSFLFEGCLTNEGATKILQEKMDEEFILRLQYRPKQGLFLCMLPFNSLSQEQIGDETI
jgi:hypothetical protein